MQDFPTSAALKRTASVKVLASSDCIIAALVDHLAGKYAGRLENTVVVLPTQRLCSVFLARVARRFGACYCPVTLTLEQLISTLTPDQAPRLIDETALVLMARALIAARAPRHVKEKHARELILFFGEIDEMGEGPEAFEKLKKFWLEDAYHHEQHVGSIIDRIDEMAQIYHELTQKLELARRTTESRLLRASGDAFAQRLDALGSILSSTPECIHIAAFTSLSPALGTILDRLCAHPLVTFWLSYPPELYAAVNPIKDLTEDLIKRGARVRKLPSRSAADSGGAEAKPLRETVIVRCPSRIDEVEAVLDRYDQLVVAGVTPAQIAILVTNESIYGPILRAAINKRGIKANLAITQPLSETAFGLWTLAISQFVHSRESLPQLMALVASPITSRFIAAALETIQSAQKSSYSAEELTMRLMEQGSVFKAMQGFDNFMEECEDDLLRAAFGILRDALIPLLSRGDGVSRLPLREWLGIFVELCDRFDPLSFIDNEDTARSAAQAWQGFTEALAFVADHTEMSLTLVDFFTIVDEQLGGRDVRQTGEPLSGLQVLSLAQARYMPFQCAMILGCNEGVFPAALPKDELIDDFLKRQIGLPGWRALEAREDLTFLLLRARLSRLVLTYAAADIDEPLVRSRFIEKLVSEESLTPVAYEKKSPLSTKKEPSEADPWLEGEFPAAAAELLGEFSASSLTCLMHCPYQFLMHRLGVRELAFASVKDHGIKEGILLHQILETFFTGKVGEEQVAEPWPAGLNDESFKNYALARLGQLAVRLGGEAFAVTPLCAHLAIEGWPRFVEHLVRLYGPDHYGLITQSQKEADIGAVVTLPFTHEGLSETRRLIGRIDSIDNVPALSLMTDYKRSRVPTQKECSDGSAPQLLFYHLALSHGVDVRDPADYLLGYYSVIDGEWNPRGVGDNVRDIARERGLCTGKTPGLSELYEATMRLWATREAVILREGRFFADSSQCGLCPFEGMCRKEQAGLKERLKLQTGWREPSEPTEPGSGT